jgi:hypothetical protein
VNISELRESLPDSDRLPVGTALYVPHWATPTADEYLDPDANTTFGVPTFLCASPDVEGDNGRYVLGAPVASKPAVIGARPRPRVGVLDPARYVPPVCESSVLRDLHGANTLRAIADALEMNRGAGARTDARIEIEQNTYRALADQLDARALETWTYLQALPEVLHNPYNPGPRTVAASTPAGPGRGSRWSLIRASVRWA